MFPKGSVTFEDNRIIRCLHINYKKEKSLHNKIEMELFVDEDEWYYLKYRYCLYSPFDGSIQANVSKSWKCDQFDGLIECIKKEIIKL